MRKDYVRSQNSIYADKVAIANWATRLQRQPGREEVLLTVHDNALVLLDGGVKVARFVIVPSGWRLQWATGRGRWQYCDETIYRTPAIPMLLVEQDSDSVFWG